MNTEPTRIATLEVVLSAVANLDDPADRLRALARLRTEVDELDEQIRTVLRDTISEARSGESKRTWSEIGDLLGVSGSRAEQLSRIQP